MTEDDTNRLKWKTLLNEKRYEFSVQLTETRRWKG